MKAQGPGQGPFRAEGWLPRDGVGRCSAGSLPCPVCFEEGRVVDDGGEQGGETPQQECREELSDDGVLWGDRGCQQGQVAEPESPEHFDG